MHKLNTILIILPFLSSHFSVIVKGVNNNFSFHFPLFFQVRVADKPAILAFSLTNRKLSQWKVVFYEKGIIIELRFKKEENL